jgi:hypothetical protein
MLLSHPATALELGCGVEEKKKPLQLWEMMRFQALRIQTLYSINPPCHWFSRISTLNDKTE